MEHRISATELARSVGDILGRIRYLGDSFVVERNGEPVARIGPLLPESRATVREAFQAWGTPDPADPEFADDLERVDGMDRPPEDRWGS
jgi:antitoxin (DNA-binding transcriptional repressor) of toxin-antitoxin stability system